MTRHRAILIALHPGCYAPRESQKAEAFILRECAQDDDERALYTRVRASSGHPLWDWLRAMLAHKIESEENQHS
jgi:hypothetical protein